MKGGRMAGRWRLAAAAVAVAVVWLAPWALAADAPPDGPPHVGTWRCVLFGNPVLGDQRMLLRFEPDRATGIARIFDGGSGSGAWVPASRWRESGGRVSFADPRTGRDFQGSMRGSALGGTWQAGALVGAWWCSVASAEDQAAVPADIPAPAAKEWLPPLFPAVMATPTYPRAAIREAREGRAVVCFLVDAEGKVSEPEVIELSDEIFRAPSLESLARSRYRGWEDAELVRPGCRSFLYRLDAITD